MSKAVLIDGVAYSPEEAKVSVYDRGFLYGDSVFETLRTYGGVLFAVDEHMRRLQRSAALTGMGLPVPTEQIAEETRRAVELGGNAESYARVMITRGTGPLGLDPELAVDQMRVVLVEPLEMPAAAKYQKGISAACVQTVRASDAASNAKLGNYLASALALREARDRGAKEALIVDREGRVVEGTTNNIFMVQGGVLLTPPLELGLLDGITRSHVLEIANELEIEIRYEALSPAGVAESDEVFLTSSIREVMPVVEVDGSAIGDGKPGSMTRRLHRAFRARVGLADQLPWEAPQAS
jgi:branched-chain amino acid aminotransferase